MDVKDFVKQTLLDMFDAVQEPGMEVARGDTRRRIEVAVEKKFAKVTMQQA